MNAMSWVQAMRPMAMSNVADLHNTLSQQLSTSRYERPYRRYRRTATVITSGGNRNPANADRSTFGRAARRRRIRAACSSH
jgi:hypothetical protein